MPLPELPGVRGLSPFAKQGIRGALEFDRFGRRATGAGVARADEPEQEFKVVDLDDVLLAVPRGLEGLVRSIADLPSLLPGIETNFSDRRLLGRSDSLVGGLLEGVSQFIVPFGLATKALGVAGGLARARNLGILGKVLGGSTFGSSLARTVAAGAFADFTAFGAHEARLSNALQQFPALAEVIPTFLAAEEDDSEIEGRLKNVLEGLALGSVTDVLPAVFKGWRAARKALAAGGEPSEALRAIEGPAGDADEVLKRFRDEVERQKKDVRGFKGDPARLERQKEARELRKEVKRKFLRAVKDAGGETKHEVDLAALAKTPRGRAEVIAEVKRRSGVTAEETALALSEGYRLLNETDGFTVSLLGGNTAKDLEPEVVELLGLAATQRLNLKGIFLEADEVAVIRGLEQVISGVTQGGARHVESEAETVARSFAHHADILGLDAEGEARFFDDLRDKQISVRERLVSATIVYTSVISDVFKALDEVNFEAGTGMERVQDAVSRLARYTEGIRGVREETGRTLRSTQITVSSQLLDAAGYIIDAQRSGRLLTKLGTREAKRRLDVVAFYRKFQPASRIGAMARFAEMDGLERSIALTNEVLVNNLLSSPKTLTSNLMFPLMMATYMPLEAMLGGALTAGFGKLTGKANVANAGLDLIRRQADMFVGMYNALGDAVHYGLRAARENRPFLTSNARELPQESLLRADTLKAMDVPVHGHVATAVNWVGKFLSFAGPVMTGTDEFVRRFTARGYIYSRLMGEGRSRGLSGPTLDAFVRDGLDKSFLEGQLLTDEAVHLAATRKVLNRGFQEGTPGFRRAVAQQIKDTLDSADYRFLNPITEAAFEHAGRVTATLPLEQGSWGASIEQAIQAHPSWRIVFPFFRTPVNLAKESLSRAGLGIGSGVEYLFRSNFGRRSVPIENLRLRNVREWASGDIAKRAEVVGRISAGASFAAFATTAALSGKLTGGGPRDPEQRQTLLSTGWQPYSIKVGDGWWQYLRADPLAAMLGIAADMVDTAKFADPSDTDFEVASSGFVMAMAQNITNKTYMQGLRTFVDAVTKGERFTHNWISRTVSSLVVPRSITSLTALTDDPVMRDTITIMEEIRSRSPFLSDTVRPQRNVLGEPIRRSLAVGAEIATPASTWIDMFLPIAYREVQDDIVNSEMRRLAHGFTPPSRKKYGARLTDYVNDSGQDAYDRWGELQGKVRIGNRSLKQALRDLVSSEGYRALPDDPALLGDRPKVRAIGAVISRYRERAWDQTLSEYPELDRAVRSYFLLRRGRSSDTSGSTNPFVRFGR